MPRRFVVPAYQLHRGSGQAKVRIRGKDTYLGPHGSEGSKQRYEELVRQLLTDREQDTLARRAQLSTSLSVAELVAAYLRHARRYYVKHGRPTNEYGNISSALDPVLERHGAEPGRRHGHFVDALGAAAEALLRADANVVLLLAGVERRSDLAGDERVECHFDVEH